MRAATNTLTSVKPASSKYETKTNLGRDHLVAETGEGCLRTLIGFGPGTEPPDDLTELNSLDVAWESVAGAGNLDGARG